MRRCSAASASDRAPRSFPVLSPTSPLSPPKKGGELRGDGVGPDRISEETAEDSNEEFDGHSRHYVP